MATFLANFPDLGDDDDHPSVVMFLGPTRLGVATFDADAGMYSVEIPDDAPRSLLRARVAGRREDHWFRPANVGFLLEPNEPAPFERTEAPPNRADGRQIDVSELWLEHRADIAGRVSTTNDIPENPVARRFSSYFLSTPSNLLEHSAEWVSGTSFEFETYWHPLGWALDDWLSTEHIGPFDDTIASTTAVVQSQQRHDEASDTRTHAAHENATSVATTDETIELSAAQKAVSRGFDVSVGGSKRQGVPALDPVTALTRLVTGAIQLGFSSGTAQAESDVAGAAAAKVANQVAKEAGWLTDEDSRGSATIRVRQEEQRRLVAQRNWTGQAANVAQRGVTRQWLATTVLAREKTVVFIPVDNRTTPFEHHDLISYRNLIKPALLDSRLGPELANLADPANTLPQPGSGTGTGTDVTMERLDGRLELSDPAEGRRTVVRITAIFEDPAGKRHLLTEEVAAKVAGQVVPFAMAVPEDAGTYRGAEIAFDHGDPVFVKDDSAEVSSFALTAHFSDHRTAVSLDHMSPESWKFGVGQPLKLTAKPYEGPVPPAATPAEPEGALLRHVNLFRSYYRLAIDLQLDSATRFARLVDRHTTENRATDAGLPVDLHPLGVAGGHIAFLASRDVTEHATPDAVTGTHLLAKPWGGAKVYSQELLSTASGATMYDLSLGSTTLNHPENASKLPTGEQATIPWPATSALEHLAYRAGTAQAADPTESAKPESAAATLLTKFEEWVGALSDPDKLATLLAAAQQAKQQGAKSSTEQADEPEKPAETPAAEQKPDPT